MCHARTDPPVAVEELRALLSYDRETGVFRWLVNPGKRRVIGEVAGYRMRNGYITISVRCRQVLAHRLAVFHVTGVWPIGDVDHRDGVRHRNAWTNLREVDRSTNLENRRREQPSNKTTGVLGACFHKGAGKFSAQIKVKGKKRHLGLFETVDEAHAAYVTAKRQLHAGCTI